LIFFVGQYAINWLDNVINGHMSAKEAFQNTPIVIGIQGTIPINNSYEKAIEQSSYSMYSNYLNNISSISNSCNDYSFSYLNQDLGSSYQPWIYEPNSVLFNEFSYSEWNNGLKFMEESSYTSDGKPRVEIAAWLTTELLIVTPYYTNTIKTSKTYSNYLNFRVVDNRPELTYNNRTYIIIGHIHSHPSWYVFGEPRVSDRDKKFAEVLYQSPFVATFIIWNNSLYQYWPDGSTKFIRPL
jgi:hypothetical protein